MNKIDREILQNKYEFLKPTPITDGLMAFGFDVGDGWLEILSDLFEKIDNALSDEERKEFKVVQVKEKFAELRVYIYGGNDKIDALIDKATVQSLNTCEQCGKVPATQNRTGWMKTLCIECREHERNKNA
jgi:hypothetical protein